jgi:hypothetical protein
MIILALHNFGSFGFAQDFDGGLRRPPNASI